ncbi:pectate lyase [Singulisphaera sp. PoT]|uniref:pectate lyase n=1 Tax=Singulisphaera sp. PoT TaxID=3411797 RepID=UPI003BF601A9
MTGAGAQWSQFAEKPEDWYRGPEGRRIAANILSYQTAAGDWPKNTDTSAKTFEGDPAKLHGTFDNGASVGELRFLARAYAATKDSQIHAAFLKGMDHILAAQYENGGWPQTSPPGEKYPRYITFNDNTMVNLMGFVRDVANSQDFAFVDESRRASARRAFDAGVACILKCQLKVDGVLTAWCAQHDEKTFEPKPARAYELVSLSGAESAGILSLLMSLERPSAEVVQAIEGGVHWFERAKLTGIRQEIVSGNKVIVDDPNAPPVWARFYEIGTNRPFFCGRDGVKKYRLADIEAERRNNYAWYGIWGTKVKESFARWSASHRPGSK